MNAGCGSRQESGSGAAARGAEKEASEAGAKVSEDSPARGAETEASEAEAAACGRGPEGSRAGAEQNDARAAACGRGPEGSRAGAEQNDAGAKVSGDSPARGRKRRRAVYVNEVDQRLLALGLEPSWEGKVSESDRAYEPSDSAAARAADTSNDQRLQENVPPHSHARL